MRVAVMFSGGKDSTYAVWLLQHQAWTIPVLVTVKPPSTESFMFHYPGIEASGLQAQALRIPQVVVETKPGDREGLEDLTKTLDRLKQEFGIGGIATGAVASEYQKTRFDRVCESLGLQSYSPLWQKSPGRIVEGLMQLNMKIIVTGVAARGLDESWLGRELDVKAWEDLKRISQRYGIHLTGEGGEYESLVLDGPTFEAAVRIEKMHKVWEGQSGHVVIDEALLVEKSPG